ncbi:MAG: hypothetical protein QM726_12575 [Chitinophagaceae bacterium]
MENNNRRQFLKKTALSAAGFGLASSFPAVYGNDLFKAAQKSTGFIANPDFVPNRIASWWTTIEDLQWPQKKITDAIKKRAEGFAKAKIDTAVNFGFHIRFDFSNYFGQMHGYYNDVCEALHARGIKFMEHYSCNHISRPKNEAEMKMMNKFQRHHVLLYHDAVAAKYAQYEGHLFNDVCEIDLRDGSLGYSPQYQLNTFCHNNPGFLDMHRKYLLRLKKEVPFDGIMVDDMCNYAGPATCGCKYCRDRFKRDYGHEIPAFGEASFWGDTSKKILEWGNYDNPVFRDWLRMKTDCIADHVKMLKATLAEKPLMTCCSNTGPIILNALSLDLEKIAPQLDFFVLENVGTNIDNINWMEMDAEALHQKDIAEKNGKAPVMALSYTIYEKGAYLGWALSRFWGVADWMSTLNHRLEEDPPDAREMEDVIMQPNNWEVNNNDLLYREGEDFVEVRLVSNRYCRENGWRDKNGKEHWDRVKAWSKQLVENNIGYRFVRAAELADSAPLIKEDTPLILDGVACVSDQQFASIQSYLKKGGAVWMALPFGTHDEKGFVRKVPLSAKVQTGSFKNLHIIDSAVASAPLEKMISNGKFQPVLKQVGGDKGWVARIRLHKGQPVFHFMNTALKPIAHPTVKDLSGIPVLVDIDSIVVNNKLSFTIDTRKLNIKALTLMSPELESNKRLVAVSAGKGHRATIQIDLEHVKLYAVAIA